MGRRTLLLLLLLPTCMQRERKREREPRAKFFYLVFFFFFFFFTKQKLKARALLRGRPYLEDGQADGCCVRVCVYIEREKEGGDVQPVFV